MAQGLIEALHHLQAVENSLRAVREQLDRKHRVLNVHTGKLGQLEEQQAAKHEQTKQKQLAVAQLELQYKARETNVDKHRQQLNAARNNKEYSAILTQLNTEQADNSKLEDRILQEMAAIDQLKSALTELEGTINSEREKLTELQAAFERECQQRNEEISQLEGNLQQAASVLEPTTLAVFQRIAERHEGYAMAKVVKPNPRYEEYICDGCNMSIPVDVANFLMTRDEVHQCQICGRILYLEAPAKKVKAHQKGK